MNRYHGLIIIFSIITVVNADTIQNFSNDLNILKLIATQNGITGLDSTSPRVTLKNNHIIKLNLSDLAIKKISPEIIGMDSLVELNLDNNSLTRFPDKIWYLKSLKVLTVKNNLLTNLPIINWNGGRALKTIEFSGNQLSKIPDNLYKKETLETVSFSNNNIMFLNSLEELPKLKTLDLSNNKLNIFPTRIFKSSSLEIVDLSYNEITSIRLEYEPMINLKHIDISFNYIDTLPEFLKSFSHLFNCAGNPRKPDSTLIFDLMVLQKIITINSLAPIDINGSRVKIQNNRIVELYLNYMGIKKLPTEIGELDSLKLLNIQDNRISEIPPEIWHLKHLDFLDAHNNMITDVPPIPNEHYLLRILDLSGNQLTQFVDGMNHLTNLETLDFSNNQFSSIDDWFPYFPNLKNLYLSHNQLIILPSNIAKIIKIKTLENIDLSSNNIPSIPDALAILPVIKSIDLSHNNLKSLPATLLQKPNLNLNVSFNKLCTIPPKYFGILSESNKLWQITQTCTGNTTFPETTPKSRALYKNYSSLIKKIKQLEQQHDKLEINTFSKSITPGNIFNVEKLANYQMTFHLELGQADCGDGTYFLNMYNDNIVYDQKLGWTITFLGDDWSVNKEIIHGSSKEDIKRSLGEPLIDFNDFLIYGEVYPNDPGNGTPDQFFRSSWFYFLNGRLQAVHLIYYMDC